MPSERDAFARERILWASRNGTRARLMLSTYLQLDGKGAEFCDQFATIKGTSRDILVGRENVWNKLVGLSIFLFVPTYTLSSRQGCIAEEPYAGNPHVRFCEGH